VPASIESGVDIVVFKGKQHQGMGPVMRAMYKTRPPTLVYNMEKCKDPDEVLTQLCAHYRRTKVVPPPTIISLNKPARYASGDPAIKMASYANRDQSLQMLRPLGLANAEDLLRETQVLGLPPGFDPAHDILFGSISDEEGDDLVADLALSFVGCDYTHCSNTADADFACVECNKSFCGNQCKDLVCEHH
jgi:hypothetical protein